VTDVAPFLRVLVEELIQLKADDQGS